MKSAVFLDRDGTVNEEVDHLSDPAGLRLIPGAAEAIRLLNEAGLPAILITNQAGVGRGLFSEEVVDAIHQELARQLAAHGARLDAIYYCPHHPDAGCACRKPQPGMLVQAAREHGLDLGRSFVAGDKLSDLAAGRRVGCQTVLVLTGYGRREQAALEDSGWQPDCVAGDLIEAVKWMLGQVMAPSLALPRPTGEGA
ncbi:MAG: D-glycero-beta-D-manno-heptose 1,7-bisphosphate 7-phosphatase [Thermoflexales bacterium]|nr:D-glycero-beta-D-manno-heptose 1,7-bisphosphate 7-phosphatase [Thermoflexales bacterium]